MLSFSDGASFTTGRAEYFDHDAAAPEPSAKILVQIQPDGLESAILAQLDTGAAWSVIDVELAEEMGLVDGEGEQITVATRVGSVTGRLEEATLTIVAQEGDSLQVTARVLVSPDWQGRTFLGYSGLLERIRFGLDPQVNHFHFGGYD